MVEWAAFGAGCAAIRPNQLCCHICTICTKEKMQSQSLTKKKLIGNFSLPRNYLAVYHHAFQFGLDSSFGLRISYTNQTGLFIVQMIREASSSLSQIGIIVVNLIKLNYKIISIDIELTKNIL